MSKDWRFSGLNSSLRAWRQTWEEEDYRVGINPQLDRGDAAVSFLGPTADDYRAGSEWAWNWVSCFPEIQIHSIA